MSAAPSPRSGTPVQNTTDSGAPSPRTHQPPTDNAAVLPERSIPDGTLENGFADDSSTTLGVSSTTGATSTYTPAWRRPTINVDGSNAFERRQSVQFVPHSTQTGSRSSSLKPHSTRRSIAYGSAGNGKGIGPGGRRLSSPPPPAQFRPSVSFDTFSNPSASDFSLTLNRKHRDYEYSKRSRTFLCGTDTNEYSDTALEWLIDELIDDGDEIVCLRVVEKDSKEAEKWSRGQGEKGYRQEAQRFLEEIEKKNNDDRAISLVLEFSIGKINDTIQQMIRIYEPAMLVVGTRGRSLTGYQGLLSSGSVSKYCLQYSPVPVIVVRPSSKREAKKKKRLQDPSRSGYRDILDKSEDAPRGRGGHLLDTNNRLSIMGSDLGPLGDLQNTADDEARRVAEAIGYRNKASPAPRGSSLSRITSARSDKSEGEVSSPPGRLLKSPELGVVDSPPGSDDEAELSDEDSGLEESIRPEDQAALRAHESAVREAEEVREEAERNRQRLERLNRVGEEGRSRSRRRGADNEEEGGGAAILDIFEKLNKGVIKK